MRLPARPARLVLTAALGLLSFISSPGGRAVASPGGSCPARWAPTPIATPQDSFLQGVVTISETDAWAVGFRGHPFATLTEHWDGGSWTVVPSPNGTTHRNVLYAVSATGPDDAWAVGYQFVDDATGQVALIEHWDGSAWSVVPGHAGSGTTLYGVKAFAPDDAWAVGVRGDVPTVTLTEHWDGSAWTVVPSPSPGGNVDNLYAVDGTSGSDVWAVGSSYRSNPTVYGLILHWGGSAWTRSRGRVGPDGRQTFLLATTAVAPGDAWAVGEIEGSHLGFVPALAHWDGARWSRVPGPVPFQSLRTFGVDAVGPDDVWAVGGSGSGLASLSLLHWNGLRWTREPTHVGGGQKTLQAISLLPSGDGWAVGWEYTSSGSRGIAIRACGV
jgi:hypothetical protein